MEGSRLLDRRTWGMNGLPVFREEDMVLVLPGPHLFLRVVKWRRRIGLPCFFSGLFFRSFPVCSFPVQQGKVFSITLCFHVLFRNEFQGGAVDAVAQSALFLRAVCENVAQVGVSRFAADFRAPHTVGEILFFLNQFFFDGAGEAGPAAA